MVRVYIQFQIHIMKTILKNLPVCIGICLVAFSFVSCATSHEPIQPISIPYLSSDKEGNVQLEYKYDVLEKKYGKKADKKDIQVIAIKITNNGDRDLVFGKDIILTYSNGKEVIMMPQSEMYKSLKQQPAWYLSYLLLTPMNLYITTNTSSTVIPVGLVVGPSISLGNIVVAANGNNKFKTELDKYNLMGVLIRPGEQHHGIIGLQSPNFETLEIKIVD